MHACTVSPFSTGADKTLDVLLIMLVAYSHLCWTAGDSTGQFSGVLDCFSKTFRREGLSAFYNGFGPNFARLGSWNVTMFLTVEQVKKLFTPKD